MSNLYFHLVRDKKTLEAELGAKVKVPAKAASAFERNGGSEHSGTSNAI